MVRYKKQIIFIFVIGIMMLFPCSVKAAKLATCRYDLSDTDSGKQILKNSSISDLKLTVNVNSDGNVDGTIQSGSWTSDSLNAQSIGSTTWMFAYGTTNLFGKNKEFYKKYKENDSCPDLQFIMSDFQLVVYVGGGHTGSTGQEPSAVISGKKNGTSSSGSNVKYYCGTENSPKERPLRGSKNHAFIYFYEEGSTKKWKVVVVAPDKDGKFDVSKNVVSENTAEAEGVITADGRNYKINPDDISKYWSDSCGGSTDTYLKSIDGNSTCQLQTSKPADAENCSYGAKDAKYDDGGRFFENQATLEGLNQKVSCEGIFSMKEGEGLGWLIQKILDYIKVAGPILVVLLSAVDFIKAIASSEEDAYKKAQSKLVIRLIAALALFLIPSIVEILLKLINGLSDPTCGFH